MIATAAFVVFGLLLLGGAFTIAVARYLSVAGLGLVFAIVAASGLCVLLGAVGLALGFVALSMTAIWFLYLYLSKGLGAAGAAHRLNRTTLMGGASLAAFAMLFQIGLAWFGIRLSLNETAADNPGNDAVTSDLADVGLSASDTTLILLTLVLVLAGFAANLAFSELTKTRTKGTRPLPVQPLRTSGPASRRLE